MDHLVDDRGAKITYGWLAEQTGIGKSTLEEIGSQAKQRRANPTLDVINQICRVLGCTPCDLLDYTPDETGDDSASAGVKATDVPRSTARETRWDREDRAYSDVVLESVYAPSGDLPRPEGGADEVDGDRTTADQDHV